MHGVHFLAHTSPSLAPVMSSISLIVCSCPSCRASRYARPIAPIAIPMLLPAANMLRYLPMRRRPLPGPLGPTYHPLLYRQPITPTYRVVVHPCDNGGPVSTYDMPSVLSAGADYRFRTGDVLPAAVIPWSVPLGNVNAKVPARVLSYEVINTNDKRDHFEFFMSRGLAAKGMEGKSRPVDPAEFPWDGFICAVFRRGEYVADIYDTGLPTKDRYPKYIVVEFIPGSRRPLATAWQPIKE